MGLGDINGWDVWVGWGFVGLGGVTGLMGRVCELGVGHGLWYGHWDDGLSV